jgi:uncharacterized glyoxalase superfamily protein PhnB
MSSNLTGRELSASLTVNDISRSVEWYRGVLGMTVDREMERDGKLASVALRAGDVRILLNQDNGARGTDRVKGEGFSLMITTTADIDAIAQGIKERGGTLDLEPTDTPWGARVFRVHDPDGFKFAVSTERKG